MRKACRGHVDTLSSVYSGGVSVATKFLPLYGYFSRSCAGLGVDRRVASMRSSRSAGSDIR